MLINQIIPAVEAAMPSVFRFHIVGKGSREQFAQYESVNLIVHDYVEDLTALMQQMDVACFPIKFGWGCKIKVLEALVSGLPIIGASQTFRGLPQQKDKICYACHSIADYVRAFQLLRNASERQRLHQAGQIAYQNWVDQGKSSLQSCLDSVGNKTDLDSIVVTREP